MCFIKWQVNQYNCHSLVWTLKQIAGFLKNQEIHFCPFLPPYLWQYYVLSLFLTSWSQLVPPWALTRKCAQPSETSQSTGLGVTKCRFFPTYPLVQVRSSLCKLIWWNCFKINSLYLLGFQSQTTKITLDCNFKVRIYQEKNPFESVAVLIELRSPESDLNCRR